MKIKSIETTLLILLLACSASGQVGDKEKAQKELERKQELERKTHVMLDEIANGAWSLKLPENRALVMSSAAELLWTRDEKRARNFFWDAINTLNLVPRPNAADPNAKPSPEEKKKALEQYFATYVKRQQLLRRVARKDPQLALEILRATRQAPIDTRSTNFRLPDDNELEQQIAADAAGRDPKRALQIAREILARGLTFGVTNLLYQLVQKDSDLASQFAGEVIDKIRMYDLATDVYAPQIAVQLLLYSRHGKAPEEPGVDTAQSKLLKLPDEQKRELIQLLTDAALTTNPSLNLLYPISELMPEIQQFAPDQVAPIERKLAAFTQTLNPEQRHWNKYTSLFRAGDFHGLVKLAGTLDPNKRESIYREAVIIAVIKGKADELREIVNKEINDESRRKTVLQSLDSEQISSAANKGRMEELEKLLPRIQLKEERARAMAEIALVFEKHGKHDDAVKLLGEARALIKTDLTSETQSNALFTLLLAYALVDPPQAFVIVEKAVDRANDQISKLLLLDKVIATGAVKKGEIKLEQAGIMPNDFIVFKYGKGLAALANADFNRTKAVADRFQRNELRLMARLLIAQALSSGLQGEKGAQETEK